MPGLSALTLPPTPVVDELLAKDAVGLGVGVVPPPPAPVAGEALAVGDTDGDGLSWGDGLLDWDGFVLFEPGDGFAVVFPCPLEPGDGVDVTAPEGVTWGVGDSEDIPLGFEVTLGKVVGIGNWTASGRQPTQNAVDEIIKLSVKNLFNELNFIYWLL
jgi:hypothetical protein